MLAISIALLLELPSIYSEISNSLDSKIPASVVVAFIGLLCADMLLTSSFAAIVIEYVVDAVRLFKVYVVLFIEVLKVPSI